ncbi:class I SAM-dependent methyltransferase [Hathewaya massiliensis]|uniref:class I SAM-dependent methyltransferase n=1 Tax=Hathewaya massiliensis TaxID=1964382 RepID=UPI00163D0452|nr:class I SAM-dependent methyltransferase [Hathewaya massiliensis]
MEEKDVEYMEGLKAWLEDTKDTKLEEMDKFFELRVGDYEEHMSPWKECYEWMAELIPEGTKELLDIGCGTGLELDRIFQKFPHIKVTGIDLAESMLNKLKRKHIDKNIKLICKDYFVEPFGKECFDVALSFQTLHHFRPEKKIIIFQKLYDSLRNGGSYIECDYIARTQEQEELLFAECNRRRKRDNIPEDVFVHFDTPLTLEHEINLMKQAGFEKVEFMGYRGEDHTPMIVATKKLVNANE